jgi:hypothetical protein
MMRVETTDSHQRFIGAHVDYRILPAMVAAVRALQPLEPWRQLLARQAAALQGAAAGEEGAGAAAGAWLLRPGLFSVAVGVWAVAAQQAWHELMQWRGRLRHCADKLPAAHLRCRARL